MTLVEPPTGAPRTDSCIPVLETKRLLLRAPRFEDAGAIAEHANNRKVAEMTANLPYPYHPADGRNFVEHATTRPDGAQFAVFLNRPEGPVFAGMCGYGCKPGESVPELGYWFGEAFWGRGLATEAARAVIDYAFSDTEIDRLMGAARVANPASRRVLEKCGFQWCGAGLTRVRAIGASVPVDRFQLEKGTWASLRAWGTTALPLRRAN
ncbi:GNAT family N-acetyltransferase [Aquabacter spiritensis]|uniref:RimJ/RimL family protein N-acetyltransferase n=1 Tax=Aquabacter spiritensis TaxID=933073 RepID=A0A4R3LRU1_9HYPH|nr:GNAT family N-acetyltransferase [Aquabacter spiritensis]TCT03140.1 RimJ/RimL family protein N-acetyltransferase [Aquabacter spiritensis]